MSLTALDRQCVRCCYRVHVLEVFQGLELPGSGFTLRSRTVCFVFVCFVLKVLAESGVRSRGLSEGERRGDMPFKIVLSFFLRVFVPKFFS